MIKNYSQLIENKSEWLANDFMSFYKIEIKDSKKFNPGTKKVEVVTNTDLFCVPLPCNRITRELSVSTYMTRQIDGTFCYNDNFSVEFVSVQCNSMLVDTVVARGLYINYCGKTSGVYIQELNGYKNLLNNEECAELPKNSMHYKFISASASNLREESGLFSKVADKHGSCDNRIEILNKATNNGWNVLTTDALRQGLKIQEMPAIKTSEFNKLVNRFGAWNTGSVALAKLKVVVVYEDKLTVPVPNDCCETDENGNLILVKAETLDGLMFLSENLEWKELRKGIKIHPKAIRGGQLQVRPTTDKASALVDKEVMNGVMRHVFELEQERKDAEGDKFKSKIRIYAPEDHFDSMGVYKHYDINGVPLYVDAFTDSNTHKLETEVNHNVDLEVLSIAKKTTATTNVQLLEKLMAHNPDVCKAFMENAFKEDLAKRFSAFVKDEPNRIPTIEEIKAGYSPEVIKTIAKDFIKRDKATFVKLLSTEVKGATNALSKMKWETEGSNSPLMPDVGALLLQQVIIPVGRYYSNDQEMPDVVLGEKPPVAGLYELAVLKKIAYKQIEKIVNALSCESWRKRTALAFYKNVCKETTVMAANPVEMYAEAGHDFDFDKMIFYYCKYIVDIMRKISNDGEHVAVKIKSPESKIKDQLIQLNVDYYNASFKNMVKGAGDKVGKIADMNSVLIQLFSSIKFSTKAGPIIGLLKESMGYKSTNGTNKYVGLPRYFSSYHNRVIVKVEVFKTEQHILSQLNEMEWSKENVLAMLFDLNSLYRGYEELSIDSVKLAITVKMTIEIKDLICESLIEFEHDFTTDSFFNGQEVKIVRKDAGTKKVFTDSLAEFQNAKSQVLNKLINVNLRNAYNRCLLTMEEQALMTEVSRAYDKEFKELLKVSRRVHRTLVLAEMNARKLANSETAEAEVRALFKARKAILADNVRTVIDNVPLSDKGLLLKAASYAKISDNETIVFNFNEPSVFSFLCDDLTISMIVTHFSDINACGYKLSKFDSGLVSVGDVIQFTNGVYEVGTRQIILPSLYNGGLEIVNVDGSSYAVAYISAHLEEIKASADKVIIPVRRTLEKTNANGIIQKVTFKEIVDEFSKGKIKNISLDAKKGDIYNCISTIDKNGAKNEFCTYRREENIYDALFANSTASVSACVLYTGEKASNLLLIIDNIKK